MELDEIKAENERKADSDPNKIQDVDALIRQTEEEILFGSDHLRIKCPFCKRSVKTAVLPTATWSTHLGALITTLLCCFPCLPMVYVSHTCLGHKHYCGECHKYVGSSKFMNCLRRRIRRRPASTCA